MILKAVIKRLTMFPAQVTGRALRTSNHVSLFAQHKIH